MPAEWSLPAAYDAIATAVADRDVLVWKDVRRTYAEVGARTRGSRPSLPRAGSACGASVPSWSDGSAGSRRWRSSSTTARSTSRRCSARTAPAVPFNVNQNYQPAEVRALFDMVGVEAVVYHRALGPLLAAALGDRTPVLIDVDDDSGTPPLAGSTSYEDAVRTRAPEGVLPVASPDDLYMVCTGGTTGSPKGVLWRQADILVAAMGGSEGATSESLAASARRGIGTWYAAPPLMHAASQWTAYACLHGGGTIVLHDDAQPFDARTILETASRERVNHISIVGDAYARPLIEELRRNAYDLSALQRLATGGATTSEATKQALFELLPDVMIIDGYGASETGGMAFGATTQRQHRGGLRAGCGRGRAVGRPHPIPRAGRRGDRVDGAARARPARLPRRRRAHGADVPDRRGRTSRGAR